MSFWTLERSDYYVETYGTPEDPEDRIKNRMRKASEYLKGDSVLDVGCGVGHLYPHLKDRIRHYTGFDASPNMLLKARHYYPDADWIEGNIYELQHQVPCFDTVYSVSLLIHLHDHENAILQLWTRVKKRLVFLIPLSENEEIITKERGLIYHYNSFNWIYEFIDTLPHLEKYEIIHWGGLKDRIRSLKKKKGHYFVVLDKKSSSYEKEKHRLMGMAIRLKPREVNWKTHDFIDCDECYGGLTRFFRCFFCQRHHICGSCGIFWKND